MRDMRKEFIKFCEKRGVVLPSKVLAENGFKNPTTNRVYKEFREYDTARQILGFSLMGINQFKESYEKIV